MWTYVLCLFVFAVKALYSKTHPQYADYLYLVAPVNLIMLNPIAFTLMEIAKIRDAEMQEQQTRSIKGPSAAMTGGTSSRGAIARRVLKGVLLNPVVLMTALGIAGNLAFQQCLPQVLEGILKVRAVRLEFDSLVIRVSHYDVISNRNFCDWRRSLDQHSLLQHCSHWG